MAGGTGLVGGGVVDRLLGAGATVAVPGRDAARLEAVVARAAAMGAADHLLAVAGDVGAPDGAAAVRDAVVAATGRVDAVVASVGGWWQGSLLADVDPGTWQRLLAQNLTPHYAIAHAFLPLLADRPRSAYVAVVGDTAEAPVRGASLSTITAAGVLGLLRSLMTDYGDRVRVTALLLGPVARDPATAPERITPEDVGDVAAWLVSDAGAAVAGAVLPLRRRPPLIPGPNRTG